MYQIIDAHCHIYPDAIARKAAASTGNFYDGLPATCDGTLGTLLQEGRQAGIDHFVVQSVHRQRGGGFSPKAHRPGDLASG